MRRRVPAGVCLSDTHPQEWWQSENETLHKSSTCWIRSHPTTTPKMEDPFFPSSLFPSAARMVGEENQLTLGSGGAAECEVQFSPIYVQPRMPAGCKELPEASVWLAEANQGKGPCGVPADEAALVIRAKGRL